MYDADVALKLSIAGGIMASAIRRIFNLIFILYRIGFSFVD